MALYGTQEKIIDATGSPKKSDKILDEEKLNLREQRMQ